jgi:deoxycytidine triphosphate deaminase/cell division protein FtsL
MNSEPALLDFAVNKEEAEERSIRFKENDPFPDIREALLNSADIVDYVRATGMLWPFGPLEKLEDKLKAASYEVDFLGTVYWSEEDENKGDVRICKQVIEKDAAFTLRKNSIAFVYLETEFRLPQYIALRFNLRITHVHRGLLLGTGPLVDPGFAGRLLIPLHNLTSKDYTLIGGEGLIWVEFTKVSRLISENTSIRREERRLVPFPKDKTGVRAEGYFNKASEGVPARSSIPGEVRAAKRTADQTAEKVSKYTLSAVIGGALTVVALVASTWSLISDANKNVADSAQSINESKRGLGDLNREIEALEARVKVLEERLRTARVQGKAGK